jgi:succinoglycan biosynthesis transport protein ExoP
MRMSDSKNTSSDLSPVVGGGNRVTNAAPSSNGTGKPLATTAVDLFEGGDRFASVSKFIGSLHRWDLVCRRYWWVVPSIMILVVGPAWFLTFNSPPRYESKARMWLAGKIDLSENRLYTEELINYLGTQAELLRSPMILQRALARVGGSFARNAASGQGDEVDQAGDSESNGQNGTGRANPRPAFSVTVAEESKSSILKLRARGPEPAATQAFLTHLMEEYFAFKKEAREMTSDRTVASAATQVEQLARDLEAQQEKLHAFQSSNNVVFLQEQGNSAGSYLVTLNKQLATLRNELRLLRFLQTEQWAERETGPKTPPPSDALPDQTLAGGIAANLAGPQLELFKITQQIQVLKAKRDELSRFLRPLHPKIVRLNEEIATQEKLAQTARDEARKQMDHRRQAIELEIRSLETAMEEWDTKAIEASRKMADYDRIRQDVQRIQGAYEKMLGLIQKVDLNKNVEQEKVSILEPASRAIPHRPVARNLGIAIAGSLLLGFGLVYGLGRVRDDFSSLTELSSHLSEEVVGRIPAISMKKTKGQLTLETLQKQRFDFLEAFRTVRSALLFMGNGEPKPRTIIIASSVPEEGKSTVSLYLSATLALGKSRVLLIDADMRRGGLHKFFGAPSRPGLAEVLTGEIPPAAAIFETGMKNVALLPAGKAQQNPGELVLSSAWSSILTEARERFDYVLIDTPPILAADDAASLATEVDGVLFVVRGSFTTARMARGALDALKQRHVRVLGLILNRAVSSRYESYYYYGRYKDSHRWEPPEPSAAHR